MTEPESTLDLLEAKGGAALAAARAEERRVAAVNLVSGVYRLIKVLRIHAEDNQATVALVETMVGILADYCEKTNAQAASILFADDTVFVNGQMLRASKDTYASANELAAILDRFGASEITFDRGMGVVEMNAFARAVISVMRNQSPPEILIDGHLAGVKLRKMRQALGAGGDRMDRASHSEQVLRTYALAIVVVRDYYADLARGEDAAPNRIRRLAQKLVVHLDEEPHLLARIAATGADAGDETMLRVHSAILATAMARRLTSDRVVLAALASSALLYDVGAVRLQRKRADAALAEAERDRLPESVVVMLTALGRIQATSIIRTVVAFEALWSSRASRRGPVYAQRRRPTIFSSIVAVARAFHDRMQRPARGAPPRVDAVIQDVIASAADDGERVLMRLLLSVLGVLPGGAPVQLTTGEQATIAGAPASAADVTHPPVRIVRDARGQALAQPVVVDLAAPSPGQPARAVARLLVEAKRA